MNPLISIIIPVYNTEKYIRRCVDSVIAQSYKDWELILVDDGSTDGSGKICDEYAVRYDKVFVWHTNNRGASHARNIGINHAKGELISFVDSDDWIVEQYVETLINVSENIDLVYFASNQIFENGDVINRIPKPEMIKGRVGIEQKLLSLKYGKIGDVFGWTWAKCFRKSIIEKYNIRFIENITFREDEIFTMDYCKYINSLIVIDKPLYCYRVRNDGLTAKGMAITDYINLADNIERNLVYFNNKEFIMREKVRVANYHIEAFWSRYRFWNVYSSMAEVHEFFKKKPEYKKYASNQNFVRIMSHSIIISGFLLRIHNLIGWLYNKV